MSGFGNLYGFLWLVDGFFGLRRIVSVEATSLARLQ